MSAKGLDMTDFLRSKVRKMTYLPKRERSRVLGLLWEYAQQLSEMENVMFFPEGTEMILCRARFDSYWLKDDVRDWCDAELSMPCQVKFMDFEVEVESRWIAQRDLYIQFGCINDAVMFKLKWL